MHAQMVALLRACNYEFRGRIGGEPRIKTFDSGRSVANASLAVDHPDKKRDETDKTDWFELELWGEEGDHFVDTVTKGMLIDVKGRVRSGGYTSKQTGEFVHQWVIKVHSWAPVGTPKPPATTATAAKPAAKPAAPAWGTSAAEEPSDEEVPF